MAIRLPTKEKGKAALAPRHPYLWAQCVVTLLMGVLLVRLWQLQILSGDLYFRKSADNFVKEIELPAARGQIRDHKGNVLADNRPAYKAYVTPRFFREDSIDQLADILHLGGDAKNTLRTKISG